METPTYSEIPYMTLHDGAVFVDGFLLMMQLVHASNLVFLGLASGSSMISMLLNSGNWLLDFLKSAQHFVCTSWDMGVS